MFNRIEAKKENLRKIPAKLKRIGDRLELAKKRWETSRTPSSTLVMETSCSQESRRHQKDKTQAVSADFPFKFPSFPWVWRMSAVQQGSSPRSEDWAWFSHRFSAVCREVLQETGCKAVISHGHPPTLLLFCWVVVFFVRSLKLIGFNFPFFQVEVH